MLFHNHELMNGTNAFRKAEMTSNMKQVAQNNWIYSKNSFSQQSLTKCSQTSLPNPTCSNSLWLVMKCGWDIKTKGRQWKCSEEKVCQVQSNMKEILTVFVEWNSCLVAGVLSMGLAKFSWDNSDKTTFPQSLKANSWILQYDNVPAPLPFLQFVSKSQDRCVTTAIT